MQTQEIKPGRSRANHKSTLNPANLGQKPRRGRPLTNPSQKCKNITVCLPDSVRERIKEIAGSRGMPLAVLMRKVLEGYVKKTYIKKGECEYEEECEKEYNEK